MTDETPRETAARQLLALASLRKLIDAEEKRLRTTAGAAFTKGGQREVAELPDGTPLGNVRLDPAKGAWKVVDADAWLRYVAEVWPDEIVETVTQSVAPGFTAKVLSDTLVEIDGLAEMWNVDTTTGEQYQGPPPGIAWVAGSTRLVVTPDKAAPEAVRAVLAALGPAIGLPELAASDD